MSLLINEFSVFFPIFKIQRTSPEFLVQPLDVFSHYVQRANFRLRLGIRVQARPVRWSHMAAPLQHHRCIQYQISLIHWLTTRQRQKQSWTQQLFSSRYGPFQNWGGLICLGDFFGLCLLLRIIADFCPSWCISIIHTIIMNLQVLLGTILLVPFQGQSCFLPMDTMFLHHQINLSRYGQQIH